MKTFHEWMESLDVNIYQQVGKAVRDIRKYAQNRNLPVGPQLLDDPRIQQFIQPLGQDIINQVKRVLISNQSQTPTQYQKPTTTGRSLPGHLRQVQGPEQSVTGHSKARLDI